MTASNKAPSRAEKKLNRCEKSEYKAITRNDTQAGKRVESARKSLVKRAEKMMSARKQAAMMIVKGGNDIEWIEQQSTRLLDLYRNVFCKVSGSYPEVESGLSLSEKKFLLEIPELAECEQAFGDLNSYVNKINQRALEALAAVSTVMTKPLADALRLLSKA